MCVHTYRKSKKEKKEGDNGFPSARSLTVFCFFEKKKNRGKKNGNEEQRKKINVKFIPFQNSFFVYFLMTEMKNGSAGIRVISYRLITMREKEKPGGIAPTMVFS